MHSKLDLYNIDLSISRRLDKMKVLIDEINALRSRRDEIYMKLKGGM